MIYFLLGVILLGCGYVYRLRKQALDAIDRTRKITEGYGELQAALDRRRDTLEQAQKRTLAAQDQTESVRQEYLSMSKRTKGSYLRAHKAVITLCTSMQEFLEIVKSKPNLDDETVAFVEEMAGYTKALQDDLYPHVLEMEIEAMTEDGNNEPKGASRS